MAYFNDVAPTRFPDLGLANAFMAWVKAAPENSQQKNQRAAYVRDLDDAKAQLASQIGHRACRRILNGV